MEMRVLFTSQPLTGHVASLVPLIQTLSDQGHAIAVATGSEFKAAVEATGARFLDMRLPSLDAVLGGVELFRKAMDGTVINDVFIGGWSTAMVPSLTDASASWRPDVIVSEHTEFAGMAVAERLGIAHAEVHLGVIPPADLVLAQSRDALAQLRRSAGLDPNSELALARARLRILLGFPNWQPDGPPPNDAVVLAAIHGDPPLNLNRDRPRIYASLGTIFGRVPGLAETVARGLDDPSFDVCFAAGGTAEVVDAVRSATRHIDVVDYADQQAAIRDADLVVCHAGFNTVVESVQAGRPMVVLPIAADQPVHAGGAVRNGIAASTGAALRRGPFDLFRIDVGALSPADVHGAVEAVLADDAYRHALHEFRARTLALADRTTLAEMLTSRLASPPQ